MEGKSVLEKKTKERFIVKKQLKVYWDRQLNIQILHADKKKLEWDMRDCEPSCVQTLSDMPRGSGGKSDPTAQMAERREGITNLIAEVEYKIWQEQDMIDRVDILIKTQIQEDQDLLILRVKERRRWENMQDILWPKYHKYTHHKSVERRYYDLVNKMQKKIDQIEEGMK